MSSMIEVAERAGVSTATVSRVLSNKPHVRPEVRARVLEAVEALGYRPNRVASSLRTQTAKIIGLLVSDIRNPFFTAVARAIEDIAIEHGYSLFLCNTDEDHEKEITYINNLFSENAAGIILSPTLEDAEKFQALLPQNMPVVTIDRKIEGISIDAVLSDNFQAAYKLTSHLIEQGYRSIGAIIGLKHSTTGRERMHGIRAALTKAGLEVNESHFSYTHPREEEGQEEMTQMLALPSPPDAIITGNSRLTIGVIAAIKRAGRIIPNEIGIAGFDETNWTPFVEGGITVISQPTYEIGKTAAELLISRINKEIRADREIVLKGELITRHSTNRSLTE